MPWQQLECFITPEKADSIIDFLEANGSLAITMADAKDNPIYEPEPGTTPLWQEIKLIALFDEHQPLNALTQSLSDQFSIASQLTIIADQAWERACMDQFQPIRFGERLWICPSWHKIEDKNAIVIHLDPGLAFGTGSHPTTQLCLEWIASHTLTDEIVVDYGCGSGILSLACAKQGAKRIYATDIDPQALQATRDNQARNDISSDQLLTLFPEELPSMQADLVIANILANPIVSLAPHLTALVKNNGKIVLSGLLNEQINQICQVYSQAFSIQEIKSLGEWGLIYGIKQIA